MADLTVNLAGLHLPNPILPGAGPLVGDGELAAAVASGGAGGLVTRTVSVQPAPRGHQSVEVRGGLLNLPSWSPLPLEQWLKTEYPRARAAADAAGIPLIISLGYTAEEVAYLTPRLAPFADAFELSTMHGEPGRITDPWTMDDAGRRIPDSAGMREAAPIVAAIRAIRAAADKPLFVKVNPLGGGEMAALAREIEAAGASGITATNSFGPVTTLDIETGTFALDTPDGHAWLSGTSLKPLALRCVFDIARAVQIPVIGAGGITRVEDAVEFLMAGASVVQITTGALKTGARFYGRFATRLDNWLNAHGYASAAEVRGLGIRRWESLQPHRESVPVMYDVAECIGCRLCEVSCHYDAIYMVPGTNKTGGFEVAEFNADRCFGCGLCVVRCPTDALLMPMMQKGGAETGAAQPTIYLHPKTLAPAQPGSGSSK
jgi:dihydroorotate dehydrogenase (NAD+) catalytic subunit